MVEEGWASGPPRTLRLRGPEWPWGMRVGGWAGPEYEGCGGHQGHRGPGCSTWGTIAPADETQVPRCMCTSRCGEPVPACVTCDAASWGRGAWAAHCHFSTETGAPALLPYQFHMEEIEGFRYRCRVSGLGRGGFLGKGDPGYPSTLTLRVHPGRHALRD